MKYKFLFVALSMGMAITSTAQAGVSGSSSDTTHIQVGGTEGPIEGHPESAGLPGIGVDASKTPYKAISLSGLKAYSNLVGNTQDNVAYIPTGLLPLDHKNFGSYAFSDTTNNESKLGLFGDVVYFGEWARTDNMKDGTHTVYYVGRDKTTNMPTATTATYTVQGINNVQQNGLMNGELTADFSQNKINGYLSNNSLQVTITDNNINPATASFSGAALANGSINGISHGEFFGNNAAKLGGIATFPTDKNLDTAFAGNKNKN